MKKVLSRRSREEWETIIAGQQDSGEGVKAYCRQQNLNTKSFYLWRKRLGGGWPAKAGQFIRLDAAGSGTDKVLKIRTPGGYCLDIPEGIDGRYVQSMLRAVAGLQ